MLPSLRVSNDFSCDTCGYNGYDDQFENELCGKHHVIHKKYTIRYGKNNTLLFYREVPCTMTCDGIVRPSTMGVAYSYCERCIEPALFTHYDTLFPKIDYTELRSKYLYISHLLPKDVRGCLVQFLMLLIRTEETQRNVRAVMAAR